MPGSSLKLLAAATLAAATCIGSTVRAGSVSVPIEVSVRLNPATECFGTGDPLSVRCATSGGEVTMAVGTGSAGEATGWTLTPVMKEAETYGGVYAASLSTRLVRHDRWEYLETTVSW